MIKPTLELVYEKVLIEKEIDEIKDIEYLADTVLKYNNKLKGEGSVKWRIKKDSI